MPLTDLSNPDVLLRENWDNERRLSADGTPTLPPSFVAESGARVWIIDVREDGQELTGPLGHIPGVSRLPLSQLGHLRKLLPAHTPVVLVCGDGVRSMTGARFLSALGMTTVAAMEGGMHQWRTAGYAVARDGAVLERTIERPAPGHGSDGRLLKIDRSGRHLTKEQITDHVGDVAKVRRVKLAAFLLASQTSCVDGREDRAIIGTPGGDAGELLLSLAAAEKVGGAKVDLDNIPAITRAFADTFGGIYLHTDNHALNHLARALKADPRFDSTVGMLQTIDDWEQFLQSPPKGLREALLEHLTQPDNVGCGHIKLALKNADKYGVRPGLITTFFTAFYEGLWAGASDLIWVVLGGDHAEGAVVNVTLAGEPLTPFTEIPMIAPSIGGVQMFVNHPQVVTYLRRQTARFLYDRVGHLLPLGESTVEQLADALAELGGQQALETLMALAAGLPVFEVHFERNGSFTVTQGDPIPTPS
ncbi:MAG: rhodanese-like domain-containing protein [Myxococcota bacterium]